MSDRISFSCSACHVPLKAPLRRAGRSGNCPMCKQKVQVPPQIPEEQGPLLVFDEVYAVPRAATASR